MESLLQKNTVGSDLNSSLVSEQIVMVPIMNNWCRTDGVELASDGRCWVPDAIGSKWWTDENNSCSSNDRSMTLLPNGIINWHRWTFNVISCLAKIINTLCLIYQPMEIVIYTIVLIGIWQVTWRLAQFKKNKIWGHLCNFLFNWEY